MAADTGKPLRRSRVSFASPQLGGRPLTVNTGIDGRYEIKELPAGQYTVSAERSGYLTLRYGQRRAQEAAQPLIVRDGQTIEQIDFTLPRTGLITGHVVDEVGDSVAGAQVFAMRSEYWRGRRQLVPVGRVLRTNDTGQFRVTDLAPGSYFIRATTRETWTVTRAGRKDVMSFLPTYFPGTSDPKSAQAITVGISEQINNIDFPMTPGQVIVTNRLTSISGQISDRDGAPADGTAIAFSSNSEKWVEDSRFIRAIRSGQDGSFQIRGLPAGEYLAVAVDYVQEGLWNDPDYLESMRRDAQRVILSEGDSQTVSLRLVTR